MRQLVATNIEQISLFAGVNRMLQELAEPGVTLAIVTSNSSENVRGVLGPDNAARTTYYEGGVSLFGKRARFQRILKQSSVLPHEAICIGDELRDGEAASKTCVPFGAVTWRFTQQEALAAATPAIIFTRMEQITECVIEDNSPGARMPRSV